MQDKKIFRPNGDLIVGNDTWRDGICKGVAGSEWKSGTVLSEDGTGKLIAFDSTSSANPPIAICGNKEGIVVSLEKNVRVLERATIRADKIIFENGTDNFDTIFEGMSLRAWLSSRFSIYSPQGYDNIKE